MVFEDGELVGPDQGNTLTRMNDMIRAQRDIDHEVLKAHEAGTDPWAQVRTIAATNLKSLPMLERLYEVRRVLAAQALLRVLNARGEAVALDYARSSSVYPTLWRRQ